MSTKEISKDLIVSYPVLIVDDSQKKLLQLLVKNSCGILWNGETLHKRQLYDTNKHEVVKVNTKMPAKTIRELLEKKYLYNRKHEGKNFLLVNPFIQAMIMKQDHSGSVIELNGKEIKVVKMLSKNIHAFYFTPRDVGEQVLGDTNTLRGARDFKNELLKKGILAPHLFKCDGIYFILNSLGKIKEVDKSYVLELIAGISKESQDKFKKSLRKSIDESLKEEPKKEEPKKEEPKKEEPKKEEPKDEEPKDEGDSHRVGYRISKMKKPMSKLKFKGDENKIDKVAKMVDFYARNIDYSDITAEEFQDRFSKEYFFKEIIPMKKVVEYTNREVSDKLIQYLYLSENYDVSDFKVLKVISDGIHPEYNITKNTIVFINTKRKVPKKHENRYNRLPIKDSDDYPWYTNDTVKNDVGFARFYSAPDISFKTRLMKDIKQYVELTPNEEQELTFAVNTRKNQESIKKHLFSRSRLRDPELAENLKSALDKAYDALTKMYIEDIRTEMISYERKQADSYARSFQDKKHVNKSTQEKMAESKFIGKNFKYVELDNDVDLDLYEKLEQNYLEIADLLPDLPEPIDLRFRRLGNHRVAGNRGAAGVYFSTVKTLAVDLDNTYSFVHEYAHALDYLMAESSDGVRTLSMKDDFKYIRDTYLDNLVVDDAEAMAYFSIDTEVFARAFELYMLKTIKNNDLIMPRLDEPQFVAFDGLEKDIDSYFGNLFG